MQAQHITEQKFSGSFFPWKKIKKAQYCSSGSLPSASILSKKTDWKKTSIKIMFPKVCMFSGSSVLKLPLFLLLVCMCTYVRLLFSIPSSKYKNPTKRMITYINSAYILNDTRISEQVRPQFLTFASLTFPTFSKNTVNKM